MAVRQGSGHFTLPQGTCERLVGTESPVGGVGRLSEQWKNSGKIAISAIIPLYRRAHKPSQKILLQAVTELTRSQHKSERIQWGMLFTVENEV